MFSFDLNKARLIVFSVCVSFLTLSNSTFASEANLSLTFQLDRSDYLKLSSNQLHAHLYLDYTQKDVNYSFPTGIQIDSFSNSPDGWELLVRSENIGIDNSFLFLSQDQKYCVRYVLAVQKEHGGNLFVKNRETLFKVDAFAQSIQKIFIYPTILGGELNQVPAGIYLSDICIELIAH